MKLEILNQLFKNKYPEGKIYFMNSGRLFSSLNKENKFSGKFGVVYNEGGKIYNFSASSVYKLAERFNLIPDSEIDYFVESENCINALLDGKDFYSIAGLSDTIRGIFTKKNNGKIIDFQYKESHKDDYDRIVYKYYDCKVYENWEEYRKITGW